MTCLRASEFKSREGYLTHAGSSPASPTEQEYGIIMITNCPDDPTIHTPTNDRGFQGYIAIPGAYGGYAKIQESSAAEIPCFWLDVRVPVDLNDAVIRTTENPEEYDGEVDRVFFHMTAEQLRALRDQINHALANHYHGDAEEWTSTGED